MRWGFGLCDLTACCGHIHLSGMLLQDARPRTEAQPNQQHTDLTGIPGAIRNSMYSDADMSGGHSSLTSSLDATSPVQGGKGMGVFNGWKVKHRTCQ